VRTRKCTPGFTLQEHFRGTTVTQPYYDWDAKYTEEPGEEEVTREFNDFKGALARLHPSEVVAGECLYANRHGWIRTGGKREKYKVSFRAWFPSLRIVASDIPVFVRGKLNLGAKETYSNLDLSVYKSREQLLGCIGSCKDIDEEKRYLVPVDAAGSRLGWDDIDPASYLAQNVRADGKEVVVEHSGSSREKVACGDGGKKRGRKAKGKRTEEAGTEGMVDAGADTSIFTTADPDAAKALSAASEFFGDRYRMQEDLATITVNKKERYIILPTKKHWCFISRRTHASNNPYISVSESGARFKCPDDQCKGTGDLPHIPLGQLPAPLRDFFTKTCFEHVDHEIMLGAKDECKRNIVTNFPEEYGTETSPINNMLTTIAHFQTCRNCGSNKVLFEHTLQGWNLRCTDCQRPWPSNPITLPASQFPNLFATLTQLNLSIGNLTVNNNFVVAGDEPFAGTFDGDGLTVFEDEALNASFLHSLQGTDAALSEFVFLLFRDEFHCCKSGAKGIDGLWYQFRDHRWIPKAELTLRKRLGREDSFMRYFRAALQFYERECIQTEDTKRKARNIKRVCEQLGDGGRRKRILEDAIELFHEYRPTFAELLDTGNKLVFTNGVYDFDNFTFRDGQPEDYLSIALKIPYRPVEELTADCAFVMEFMTAIQPDEATRDYLLTILSLCLTTDTSLQYFWILTGGGANGKSKLMNFLMETLGDHFGTAPAALLTRRREDANQANESLSALEKVRIAVFSEGSASEVLQVNTIKLFSGEDTISTRGLHEKQRRWKPIFKVYLVCNDIPILDDNSWPAWRRIMVVHFPTLFCDNPRRPHEKQKDPEVGTKLSACRAAFISILIEYYKRFKACGLSTPPAVAAATQKYQTENDVFAEFKDRYIIEEKGADIPWKTALPLFENWSRNKRNAPKNAKAIKALFIKELGPFVDNNFQGKNIYGWRHYRLVNIPGSN